MWWNKAPSAAKSRREELAEARNALRRQIEILRNPARRADYTNQSAELVSDLSATLVEIEEELADEEAKDDA